MNFEEAMKALKDGKTLKRTSKNKGELNKNNEDFPRYIVTYDDFIANDWEIVEL